MAEFTTFATCPSCADEALYIGIDCDTGEIVSDCLACNQPPDEAKFGRCPTCAGPGAIHVRIGEHTTVYCPHCQGHCPECRARQAA